MKYFPLAWLVLLLMATESRGEDGWFEGMIKKGLTIRKSFDGTAKDAVSPAEISYQNPDDGESSYKVDLAIKVREFGWLQDQLRLYPVLEHHRNSQERDESNKTSAGAILQYGRSFGRCTAASGRPMLGCNTLLTDLTWKFTRDSQNDTTTRFAALKFGLDSGHRFAPGWEFSHDSFAFSYYPTLGLEVFENLPIKQKVGEETVLIAPSVDESFWFARLNIGTKLFPAALDNRLALTMSYTNRGLLGSSDTVVDTNELLEASLDWYFDEKRRVGIGISYQNGRDPKRNFLDEESSSIGLKFRVPAD